MTFFVISDKHDTYMGLRLAGIEGVIAENGAEAEAALKTAASDPEIGIVLMTERLAELCADMVLDIKLNRKYPLIVEIPDREHTADAGASIEKYLKDALGIQPS